MPEECHCAVHDGNSKIEKELDDDYTDRKMLTVSEMKQKEQHTYDEPETQKLHSTKPCPPPQKGDKVAIPCVRCQTHGETCYAQEKTASHRGHAMNAGH